MDRVDHEPDEQSVVDDQNRDLGGRHRISLRAVLVVIVSCIVLAAPFSFHLGGFAAFAMVGTIGCTVWIVLLLQPNPTASSFRSILLLALLLRVPMMLYPPDLSNDALRYLWDGVVTAAGINPYSYTPDDPRLAKLRTEWHGEINHRSVRTIYPPHAQLLFLLPGSAGGSLLIWRLILLVFETAVLRMLYHLRPHLSLLWAIFPLAVWEGSWNAHVDLAMATVLLFALLEVSKPVLSGAALGFAAGLKLMPLVTIPAFVVRERGALRWAIGMLAVIVLGVLPFLGGPFMSGLSTYSQQWSFNGPLYLPLVTVIESLGIDSGLRVLWSGLKDAAGLEFLSARVYAHLYPEFVARVSLALGLFATIGFIVARTRKLDHAVADSLGVLLLFSPTVHPWYWVSVALVALAGRRSFWLFLAAASPASYLLYASAPVTSVLALSYLLPIAGYLLWARATGAGQSRRNHVH